MNRFSFIAGAVIMLVSAPFPTLRTQSFEGRQLQFGLMGGFTKPIGDLSPSTTHAGNVGALMTLGAPTSRLRFRLDGQWPQITGKTNSVPQLACPSCSFSTYRRDFRVLDATANAVYSAKLSGAVGLYAIGGAGVYDVRGTVLVHQGSLVASERTAATRLGFNAGAGMSFRVGHLATFIEARVHSLVGSHAYENDGFDGALPGAFQLVPVSVGIIF